MDRRDFLKKCAVAAGGFALSGCAVATEGLVLSNKALKSRIGAKRPNIIFIMADDLGYGDLSCYGATKVSTPNIDRIAEEGMRFTDAHTPSAVCSPTRYGVLTGRYCWRTRLKSGVCLPNDPLLIDTKRMTVASLLKSVGYTTGCVGKWHLGFGERGPDWNGELKPGPLEIGFDYYFGVPVSNNWPPFVYVENHHVVGRLQGETITVIGTGKDQPIPPKRNPEKLALVQTDKAIKFIERSKDEPFFLYLAPCNVHEPHTPNEKFKNTSEAGTYGDFIKELDWTVNEVTKTLDRLNLTDNTLLIVTSDNGAITAGTSADYIAKPENSTGLEYGHRPNGLLRGQKADIWEGGHRVPFISRWPGRIKAGTISDELICLTDFMATCAAIVGKILPDNAGEDSYNILPALLGEKLNKPIREAIVHHSAAGMFAIRQGPWKLIPRRGSGGFTKPIRYKPKPGEPAGQLYNMANDLSETNNLWSQHPKIVKRLTKLLGRYRKEGRSRPLRGK
ncbi:MAG TPA: twin-arginine translocation signal domain-containing protein [Phycisphaerales bacterium]|nr:twin-arginine translocation signal domain-containing protein [Phycisphaerales bacterium]